MSDIKNTFFISRLSNLKRAYLNSHFAPAFFFLSTERSQALKTLYAVLRVLDDAVDQSNVEDPQAFLESWKKVFSDETIDQITQTHHRELASHFIEVMRKFELPKQYLLDFIDQGVAVDLKKNIFETPMDLESYCYGVAGTVGVLCLPIFGVPWVEAKDYAIRLGIAIQWVNVIRDVGVDAQMGRIYIPQDHLEKFQYDREALLKKWRNSSFETLIEYETKVARSYFQRAEELKPLHLNGKLLPAKIMGKIYERLLSKLEANHFPVFNKKIRLNLIEKVLVTWQVIRNK
ncbi:MAG: phytoene/squalene synthase family protein [Elusimicrobiota bacterium]